MKTHTIKDNLLFQRKSKGFTQEELSEKSTVAVRTIQRIEKGEVQPHLQTIKLLAEALAIQVEDLIVIEDPSEEPINRKYMMLFHASPFFGFIIPFANILFPLFIWLSKGDKSKTYDQHGRAVINFHSSITLYFIVSLILFFAIPGYNYFLTAAIYLFGILFSIKNTLSSMNSGRFFYPLSIPFLPISTK